MKLMTMIDDLIRIGKREIFHDGIDGLFAQRLEALLPDIASDLLDRLDTIPHSVYAETLTQLTRHIDRLPAPAQDRLHGAIKEALSHPALEVRDSAINCIDSLEDRRFVPALRDAIETEQNGELKQDMIAVLEQLEDVDEWQ